MRFNPLNTHSLFTLTPAALAIVLAAGWLLYAPWLGVALAGVGAIAAGGWALAMRTQPAPVESFEALESLLQRGTPTVVEVFSNY